jgi:hypothetical protein
MKSVYKNSLYVLLALSLSGCIRFTPHNAISVEEYININTTKIDKTNYTIGKKNTCFVGNEIIKVDKYNKIDYTNELREVQTKYKALINYKALKKDSLYMVDGWHKEKNIFFIRLFEDTAGIKYIRYNTVTSAIDENLFDSNGEVIAKNYFSDEIRDSKVFSVVKVPYVSNNSNIVINEHNTTTKGFSYSLI